MSMLAAGAKVAVAVAIAACATPTLGTGAGQDEILGARVLEGELPGQLCTRIDQATSDELLSGRTRLVLVLSEFHPPSSGTGSLRASFGGDDQVLGIFPAVAFDREEEDQHRRFVLAAPTTTWFEMGEPACVSVRLESPDGSGQARLELATWKAADSTGSDA